MPVGDEKGFAFAKVKPDKVTKYMREFSQPRYGVDVLKVEVPVNMRYVEGTDANTDGQVAYSRDEAKAAFPLQRQPPHRCRSSISARA